MTPDLATLYAAIDATWPAHGVQALGSWQIREGRGGGQRVSAATLQGPFEAADIAQAEAAMRDLGQTPLFMIRAGQEALDAELETRGYRMVDPVNLYAGPIDPLADRPTPQALVFSIWPHLAIQADIWAEGGIGPDRIAVMQRAQGPRTTILGRHGQTPAATGYVAVAQGVAMVHALEVVPDCRRLGVGAMVTEHAAKWGRTQGARHIAALSTQDNAGANALYASLGLSVVGQYHYRKWMND